MAGMLLPLMPSSINDAITVGMRISRTPSTTTNIGERMLGFLVFTQRFAQRAYEMPLLFWLRLHRSRCHYLFRSLTLPFLFRLPVMFSVSVGCDSHSAIFCRSFAIPPPVPMPGWISTFVSDQTGGDQIGLHHVEHVHEFADLVIAQTLQKNAFHGDGVGSQRFGDVARFVREHDFLQSRVLGTDSRTISPLRSISPSTLLDVDRVMPKRRSTS